MDVAMNSAARLVSCLMLAGVLLASGGCATTDGGASDGGVPHDPWEGSNRAVFGFNDALDRALLEPIADVYSATLPAPLRGNVYNFFDNLAYPNVAINAFLQGKFEQGVEDTGRFLVNSTFGFAGVADVATGFGLARHDEDFGQTLAVWGLPAGPHVELPLLGPNTLRSLPGLAMAMVTNPSFYLGNSSTIPATALKTVDQRARLGPAIKLRNETALDPYVFQREAFRQRRRYLAYDGDPPLEDFEDLSDGQLSIK